MIKLVWTSKNVLTSKIENNFYPWVFVVLYLCSYRVVWGAFRWRFSLACVPSSLVCLLLAHHVSTCMWLTCLGSITVLQFKFLPKDTVADWMRPLENLLPINTCNFLLGFHTHATQVCSRKVTQERWLVIMGSCRPLLSGNCESGSMFLIAAICCQLSPVGEPLRAMSVRGQEGTHSFLLSS